MLGEIGHARDDLDARNRVEHHPRRELPSACRSVAGERQIVEVLEHRSRTS